MRRTSGAPSRRPDAGLHVEKALDILGIMVGSIEETSLERLHDLPWVSSVEREWHYGVPTPVRGLS